MNIDPEDLPPPLDLRTRPLTDHGLEGAFVLYWMRTAVRVDENPALEVALEAGARLGLPVFVYHAVSERYRYASDRHHTFILEGARDVAEALAERGIGTAFHCERPGHRGPHLRTLAERAALVVTEEMPVHPLRQWTRRLADALPDTPVWAVDTACVVPMRSVGKGVTRAYAYRDRITPHLDRFLDPLPAREPTVRDFVPDLPFEPVDWSTASIPELVASCDIDHDVAPVPHTRGGTEAGRRRWAAFVEHGLDRYARDRNDPVLYGTSRMSPYLHYGMVAPTRVARDALDHGGKGARKYVDELVVWRELAHTWCLYAPEHETLDALPEWARQTLQAHASDPRPATYDEDDLRHARTGNTLWDAAQTSLLRHGELHNNLRMTWAKALVPWTPSPEEALRLLIDFNHRYALDGRDPASYGGLLWCLGQFDRPFPESPVFGRVRSRSLARAAQRLDLDAYRAHVERSPALG